MKSWEWQVYYWYFYSSQSSILNQRVYTPWAQLNLYKISRLKYLISIRLNCIFTNITISCSVYMYTLFTQYRQDLVIEYSKSFKELFPVLIIIFFFFVALKGHVGSLNFFVPDGSAVRTFI